MKNPKIIFRKFKSIFYRRIPEGDLIPKWMNVCYFDYCSCNKILILFPFHYIYILAWKLNYYWCKFKNKPSWIDKQVRCKTDFILERRIKK